MKFEVDLDDGRTVTVEAANLQEAADFAQKWAASNSAGPSVSGTESFLRGGADMLTFGLADEIGAGVETGGGLWGDYDKELEAYRGAYSRAQEANPGIYLAGQIAGAVAPAIATGGAGVAPALARTAYGAGSLARGAGLGRAALQSAAYGAGQGAAYGFGSGEGGLEGRLPSAGAGAAFGAAGGAAAPFLGRAVGAGAERIARGARGAGTRITQRVQGLPPTTPAERRAAGMVAQNIDEAGMTVDEALAGVGPGRPLAAQNATLADAAGSVSRGSRAARTFMQEGAEGAFQRSRADILSEMQKGLGGADNSVKWLANHRAKTQAAGNKAYPQAFDRAGEMTPDQVAWLESQINVFPEMYKQAQRQGGKKNLVTMAKDANGRWAFRRPPTYADAEIIQRGMRDVQGKAIRANAGGEASNVGNIRRELRSMIDQGAPEIATVRARYADDKAIEDAFDYGKTAFTDSGKPRNFEEVQAIVSDMSDPELAAFSRGVWARVRQGIGGRKKTSQAVIGNLFETEDGMSIMRLALGDQGAEQAAEMAGRLDAAGNLVGQITGGSATARRMADDATLGMLGDVGTTATAAGAGDAAGVLSGIVGMGRRIFANPPSDEQLQAAGRLLISENPQEIRRMMNAAAAGDVNAAEALRRAITAAVEAGTRGASRSIAPQL